MTDKKYSGMTEKVIELFYDRVKIGMDDYFDFYRDCKNYQIRQELPLKSSAIKDCKKKAIKTIFIN